MTNSVSERKCPLCGETDIESKGVIATYYPRRIADLAVTGYGKRMIESKFRCRSCGHEFAQIEDYHF